METTSILGWFSLFGQSDFVDDSCLFTPKCIKITFYKVIHATHSLPQDIKKSSTKKE